MAVPTDVAEVTGDTKRPRRWVRWAAGVTLLVAGAIGWFAWSQYRTLSSSKYNNVAYTVPKAPALAVQTNETVYRVDPTHSSLTYGVDEKFFGQDASRARGETNGINGDIAINTVDPTKSRVGQIVVNVEQLHSDNNLRDARMRSDNLESHRYKFAYLSVGDLSDLPKSISDGRTYKFRMPSQLTVKETPAPVTWDVEAKLTDGKLEAMARATVKMSTFNIGPISVAGLVSTGDDVDLTMKLTALDPSKSAIPASIPVPEGTPRSGDSPSFKNVVLPAMEANCASCHQAGEVGAAHWKFETAGDAERVADGLGTVVKARYMPPWPASDAGVPLAHSKRLSEKTVNQIVAWAHAGGPLDIPASTKVKVRKGPTPKPPRRDAVLKMPEGYAGTLSVPNDYRCFVLDPKITEPMFMTGYQVDPGVRREIHHAQIFHQDARQAAESVARSGKDGKPGWSCYASPSGVSARRGRGFSGQAGLVAGWVPGQDPVIYAGNSGILMQPGDVLVLQMHYHYDTTPVPDRSTVSIQLDPGTAPIKQLDIVNPIGPVEIPCNPGQTDPLCDRDAALAENVRVYGGFGAIEPALLGLCGKTHEDLAARFFKTGIASTDCTYSVPASGTIIGVLGHMHTLGTSFRFTLDPGTPQEKVLLDIPTWNFDWQMNYELETPLHVEKGQKIKMECSWDRSVDPNRPPRYIVFAEGTEDEMCFGTYALVLDEQPTP
ncbi:MAG: YceI family protein [Acidimicrobiia bacterium]|nr:YceI family protein [Acidimicrobiia bacterium]